MNDWKKLAEESANETNEKFKNKIASLTRLNNSEIEDIINNTGISQKDLASILAEVKDAQKSNEKKAENIGKIASGVKVLIEIASKMI